MSQQHDEDRVVLHEPEQAIGNYLDALLSATGESRQPQAASAMADRPPTPVDPVSQAAPGLAVGTGAASHGECAPIIPKWAEQPFQCLPFRIRGVSLAIPLMAVRNILKWERDLSPIPAQPAWHLGVMPDHPSTLVVVDAAQLLLPGGAGEAAQVGPRGRYLLIIGDGYWGLACDSLLRPITLDARSVRWPGAGEGGKGIAGTVEEKGCLLLDMDALLSIIEQQREE